MFKGIFKFLKNTINGWLSPISEDNPVHNGVTSLFNKFTEAGLTGSQIEQNNMSMQNAEDIYQRQVSGMQKAGLNAALMYQNGASGSAPEAPSQSGGMSMSELIQAFMLPAQRKLIDAQADNLEAAAEQKRAETETERIKQDTMSLALKYYPSIQEATLDEVYSRIGVNWSTVDEKEANAALTWSKEFLQQTENKYAEEYFHWRNELEKAQTAEAEKAALSHMAEAAWIGFQHSFASQNGYDVHAGGYVALASMLTNSVQKADTKLREDSEIIGNTIVETGKKLGITDQQLIEKGKKVVEKGKSFTKRNFSRSGLKRNFNRFRYYMEHMN